VVDVSDRDLVNSASDWVDGVEMRWAKFTVRHPRLTKREYWNEPLKVMFRVLRNTYPKTTVKKHRSRAGIPNLQHITFLGGDCDSGVALHAQGLVEVFDGDIDLTRLNRRIGSAWSSAAGEQMKHQYQRIGAAFDESKVWVEVFDGGVGDYLGYLARNEGPYLGFGLEKQVVDATVLRHRK
jgi:hypothetical protein